MLEPQEIQIQEIKKQISDGVGGLVNEWGLYKKVFGFIDLVTGTDQNAEQNAFVEDSTHILIIPEFTSGIKDDMRIVDDMNRCYLVTYSDNPVNVSHHNEIYLKFEGVLNGTK